MTEKTRKIVVFSTLPVAIAWGYFTLTARKSTDPSQSGAGAALSTVQPLTAPVPDPRSNDSARLAEVRAQAWGVDPFRGRAISHYSAPVSKTTSRQSEIPAEPAFILNGIIYSESSPIAYINGQLVKVGDKVNAAKVITIDRRIVILDINGRRTTLSLSKETRS